jgi:glutathione peroxidase
MNIYDLSFTDNSGNEIKLESFKGKDILIVNTASQCGYTKQYEDLQKIQSDSVVVIGFPCNQFGNQEPGTTEEIKTFCTNVYGITFPISQKVEVNGPNAHPVYKYLKENSDITNIGWNFEKFLVSKDGLITHYPSSHQVSDII